MRRAKGQFLPSLSRTGLRSRTKTSIQWHPNQTEVYRLVNLLKVMVISGTYSKMGEKQTLAKFFQPGWLRNFNLLKLKDRPTRPLKESPSHLSALFWWSWKFYFPILFLFFVAMLHTLPDFTSTLENHVIRSTNLKKNSIKKKKIQERKTSRNQTKWGQTCFIFLMPAAPPLWFYLHVFVVSMGTCHQQVSGRLWSHMRCSFGATGCCCHSGPAQRTVCTIYHNQRLWPALCNRGKNKHAQVCHHTGVQSVCFQ